MFAHAIHQERREMATSAFVEMALIAFLGGSLRYLFPDLNIDELRPKINRLVLAVFLPALNFRVIYDAELGEELWQVPLCALTGLAVILTAGHLIYLFFDTPPRVKGSLVLAGAFGNVTYLGMPILQRLYPSSFLPVTVTVILYEMTITPLNPVVGSALAASSSHSTRFSLKANLLQVTKMPLLWAIIAALLVNWSGAKLPAFGLNAVSLLADIVPGLMILSLGMALKLSVLRSMSRAFTVILPAIVLKLVISPLVVFAMAHVVALPAPFLQATILEAAMPSQLVTFLTADRYGLDTEHLAVCVFLDTVLSFVTIPLVQALLVPPL
jgi:predicted permease